MYATFKLLLSCEMEGAARGWGFSENRENRPETGAENRGRECVSVCVLGRERERERVTECILGISASL